MHMNIPRTSLAVLSAVLSMGAQCSESGTRDAGHQPDGGRVECLVDGDVCLPAFDGAACGPAFAGSPVDLSRRCIDTTYSHRITIGCLTLVSGGSPILTCYQYDAPSGSGVAWMGAIAGPLARTAITATRCPDDLQNQVSSYPACE